MAKKKPLALYCRFWVDGRTYSGTIRDNSVDIVEGDPFTVKFNIMDVKGKNTFKLGMK